MEPAVITGLMRQTLDPAKRVEAENELAGMKKIIGFSPCLLQIVMNAEVDPPVRQAAAIFFKNFVIQSWADKEYDPKTDGPVAPFSIHEQDRGVIRENLVEAIVAASDALRLQIGICFLTILRNDFPGRWPQVVDKISIFLQTPEPQKWPGALLALHQLVKIYEYKKKEERAPLYDALNLLLPQVYNIIVQCMENAESNAAAEIRKQILKTFYALTQYILPLELLNKEFFTKWMEVCNNVLLLPVPASAMEVDKDERPSLMHWKEKKWALHILTRMFERYGSPGNVVSEYKEFSEWYINTFSNGFMETNFKILANVANNIYVSPRVVHNAIMYVNTGVSHAVTWKLIKPHAATLIKNVIFPLMSYSQEDDELWNTDPYEYIRIKFDVFEDFVSPVTASQSLLHSICKKRKDILPQTMEFLLKVLQDAEVSADKKDGALHMIGSMADILMKKKEYKGQMEDFLMQLVFPQFQSSFGHMRARACWMFHYFAEIKFKNQNVLITAFKLTTERLLDPKEEIPVKVEAAIAVQMLLTNQEDSVKPIIEPQIGEISLALLNIIRDTENEDLTTVMQKIVCTYTEQLIPFAVNICQHLVATFAQIMETSDGEDKAITAMGLLNTMETVLAVMESREDVHNALEPIVLQAVHHIFKNGLSEFYEEALTICCDLTTSKISNNMWEMLAAVCEVFNRDEGTDYFIDMMPLLHNYVTVNTDQFLSNPAYISAMFNMAKKMLESNPGEDPECHAGKLLEVIILQCKNRNIDQFVTSSVELVLQRLGREILTSELRTMCLQVAIAALFYNPDLFFGFLQQAGADNSGNSVITRFIDQWLSDTDCFIGLHDRKLSVLGLCCILTNPAIPGVQENCKRFFPSLILLFDGLKRAYENQNESSSGEESSDEEDEDSGDCLESDEDEIDEQSTMYLESLQKKIISTPGGLKIDTSIRDDDDDDDDDDSIYADNSLEEYTTPIDDENSGVDEYAAFKNLLMDLETNKKEWYTALTADLTVESQKKINEIMTLCAQRQAQQESKNIERAGGYSFQQQTVPNQFSFGTNNGQQQFTFGK